MKFLLTFVVTVFSLLTMAGEDYGGKTALVADVKIAAGKPQADYDTGRWKCLCHFHKE